MVTGRTRYYTDRQVLSWYLRLFFCLLPPLLLLLLLLLLSSASLSDFHLVCTSTSLGATSLRFHLVPFHAAVCCQAEGSYIAPGATLLGSVRIWYPVNRLLRQALAASVLLLGLGLPFCFFFFFLFFFFLLLLLLFCFSLRLPPRVHIKLPWGHLSMSGGLAAGI